MGPGSVYTLYRKSEAESLWIDAGQALEALILCAPTKWQALGRVIDTEVTHHNKPTGQTLLTQIYKKKKPRSRHMTLPPGVTEQVNTLLDSNSGQSLHTRHPWALSSRASSGPAGPLHWQLGALDRLKGPLSSLLSLRPSRRGRGPSGAGSPPGRAARKLKAWGGRFVSSKTV